MHPSVWFLYFTRTATRKISYYEIFFHITQVHKYENCQELESENDQIITWKNWQFYWTLIEAKEINLEQEQYWQCWNESTKWYIGFGTKGNYEDAFALCTSFGGSLPLPDT